MPLILIKIFKMMLKCRYTQTRHLWGKCPSSVMSHLFSVLLQCAWENSFIVNTPGREEEVSGSGSTLGGLNEFSGESLLCVEHTSFPRTGCTWVLFPGACAGLVSFIFRLKPLSEQGRGHSQAAGLSSNTTDQRTLENMTLV